MTIRLISGIVILRVSPAVSAEAAAAAGVEPEDCFLLLCALLVEDSLLAEVNALGPSSAAAAPSEYKQFVNVGMYVGSSICISQMLILSN